MRSGDAGNAVFSNLDGFVRVMVDEVITPAGGVLEEVILVCTSEHIYDNDLDQVESLIGKIPENMKKLLRSGKK
jgi:thymidylate synthase